MKKEENMNAFTRMKPSSKMVVITIIIAIFIVGINILKGDPSKNLQLNKKAYCKGVEFKVPDGWKASGWNSLTDNEYVYQQRDNDRTNVGMEKIFVKYQGKKNSLTQNYAKNFIPDHVKKLETSRNRISGSNNTFQFDYFFTDDNDNSCAGRTVVFTKKGEIYSVNLSARKRKFSSKSADKFIKTFNLNGINSYDSLMSLKGKKTSEAIKLVKKLNFDATYYEGGFDMTDHIDSEADVTYITSITDFNLENKSVTINIASKYLIKKKQAQKQLSKKFPVNYAWSAVKQYGAKKYPYGFKVHTFSGNLEESAKNSNTWFLQATCTVTNEYGAELDGYCEAKVTGNKDNPKVNDFKVYKLH